MRHGWREAGGGRERRGGWGGGEQVQLRAKFICGMLNVGGLVVEQTQC